MPYRYIFLHSTSYVLLLITTTFFSATALASEDVSGWKFELTPYIWAAGLDGHTIADNFDSPIDNDYSFFILENLDAVASFSLEASKQRWSILFDGLYTKFSDDINRRFFETDLTIKLGFIEAATAYQIVENRDISVIFGARYIYTDTSVEITPGPSVNLDKTWLDPFIGLKGTFAITDSWSVTMRGDIGGKNDADFVVNTVLSANYRITNSTTLKLGYRYMKMKLKQNRLVQDISLSGLGIGLGISF